MRYRPILFSSPMVRALLSGTKTQTRRVLRDQDPVDLGAFEHGAHLSRRPVFDKVAKAVIGHRLAHVSSPYGAPGDRLWVKETWAAGKCGDGLAPSMLHPGTWLLDNGGLWYPGSATEPAHPIAPRGKTRVSIHMPRWASRITLKVVGVRVERLQSCSADDALAEGITHSTLNDPRVEYRWLWESINGPGSWDANPWVWVVEFRRLEK